MARLFSLHPGICVGACGAMLLLNACATPESAAAEIEPAKSTPSLSSEDCLFSIGIESWEPVDRDTFVIYGPGRQDAYIGRLAIPSIDLPLNFAMAFIDDDRNGRICGQSSDSVVFREGSITKQKVFITSLRKTTRAEADRVVAEAKEKAKAPKQPAADPR